MSYSVTKPSELKSISKRLGGVKIIKAYVSGVSCAAICEGDEVRFSINGYKSELFEKCFVDQKYSYAVLEVENDNRGSPQSIMIDDSTDKKRVLAILYGSTLDIYNMSKTEEFFTLMNFSSVNELTGIYEGIVKFSTGGDYVVDGSPSYYVDGCRVISENLVLIAIESTILIEHMSLEAKKAKLKFIVDLLTYPELLNIYNVYLRMKC